MADTFDDFVEALQSQIDEDTRQTYGEKFFQRWKNPRYLQTLMSPDGYAKETGSCGDTIEVYLKFEKGRVSEAGFQTDGCGTSLVCGSYAAQMAMEKTPEGLSEISGEDILAELGGLPAEDEHCAFLSVAALQSALEDYMSRKGRCR
ncbi:MAG: iron-sulfur cluster assembly scaffold protein [Desulfobacterales bacterium]|nr:iron-sulfur cluster assembly scaffold protein [Desulfobacterales bacterium]